MKKQLFHSNGKLLLSGEYAVLDGALSLAVPTVYGQFMEVEAVPPGILAWQSEDHQQKLWFETSFELSQLDTVSAGTETADRLVQILRAAQELNPEFLSPDNGFRVRSKTNFPRDWGLGTSSTLINNIANWASIDPYLLLKATFGGSGYDIACAKSTSPILYQLQDEFPTVQEITFNPPFKDQLYFVYLNQKQDSREGIAKYRNRAHNKEHLIFEISRITRAMVSAFDLENFEALLAEHENLISKTLIIPTVKEKLFPDFTGSIKSLGAWGGDFVLATGGEETPDYFKRKGYNTVIPYYKMVLNA